MRKPPTLVPSCAKLRDAAHLNITTRGGLTPAFEITTDELNDGKIDVWYDEGTDPPIGRDGVKPAAFPILNAALCQGLKLHVLQTPTILEVDFYLSDGR